MVALNIPGAVLSISEFTKWKIEVGVLETGGHVSSSDSDGEEPERNLKSGSPLPVTTSDTPTEPQLRSISDSFWMSMSAPDASIGPNSSSPKVTAKRQDPVEKRKSSPKKKAKKSKKSAHSMIDDIFSQLG